jgi:hypothetical protein
MDRRAKKIEQKRKNRNRAKKHAAVQAARKPDAQTLLIRGAVRGEFGPCFINSEWSDLEIPALVSVVVTRKLPTGELLPVLALVDRTCLGVKNAFTAEPLVPHELAGFVESVGQVHADMLSIEPLIAQSVVFNAVDYARSLGFEPHEDFVPELFGPRPEALVSTPWSSPDKPIFFAGPTDNAPAILHRVTRAVGAEGFDYIDVVALADDDNDLLSEGRADSSDNESPAIIHSPLERHLSRDGIDL